MVVGIVVAQGRGQNLECQHACVAVSAIFFFCVPELLGTHVG